MTEEQKKFELYLVVLRFLVFKITNNLERIYMDVDVSAGKILLTAFYTHNPSALELELLDDIETNSNAHIPDLFVESRVQLIKDHSNTVKHDFVVFARYSDI